MLNKLKIMSLMLIVALFSGATYASEQARQVLNEERAVFKTELKESFAGKETIEYGAKPELKLPENMEIISHYDEDYSKPGLYKETIIVQDKEDERISASSVREIEVVDKTAPEIKGVKNRTTTEGEKIDLLAGVSSKDEIDGKLDVKVEGDYSFSKPGTYKLKAVSSDKSGNKATKKFTLTVNEKPKPIQPVQKAQPAQPSKQASGSGGGGSSSAPAKPAAPAKKYNQMYFHRTGATVHFVPGHSSVSVVQPIIDNNPWTATIWSVFDGVTTHSNTDGRGTYFIGHASHAFQSAMYMSVGEQVTVWDGTGNARVYTVQNRIVSGKTYSEAQAAYNTGSGEFIFLQTCLPNNDVQNAYTILK